jgi:integrase/recombinase XerD
MTSLRRRMTEDMQVRNLSPHTQASYVQQVSLFARHFNQSPEVLGPEEIRSYQVYLTNEKKLSPGSILIAVAALRFLYKVTLHKDWSLEEIIPAPKKPQKLPVVLSPEEVLQFLSCVHSIKHRTILTVCYAAGLRISEAISLKVADIDNKRMVIRVEQGKCQKDRYVMLSPKLLEVLRAWWPVEKPKQWLFPGDRVGSHITKDAVELACQKAHRRCGISQTDHTPFASALFCNPPARIRNRRAHHPTAARSSQPGYHRPLSAHRHNQAVLHQEPARSASAAGCH